MAMKKIFSFLKLAFLTRRIKYSQSETEKILAQQALVKILAGTRGISMKVGQLFSDFDGSSEFQTLVEGIQPLPLKKMLPVLEHGIGSVVKKQFKTIEPSASAASLGQVHFAVLNSGEEVAIKIRYPDIAKAVDEELKLAGLFPGIGPIKTWSFDVGSYKSSLRNNMLRELDYLSEAKRQNKFAEAVQVDGLHVPAVYHHLCSECVLVQSRAHGVLINDVVNWPRQDKQKIGFILLSTLFKSLFVAGEVHGDPHAGNVFFDYDSHGKPRVSLLDYGCTIAVSEKRRMALLKLIVSCRLKQQTAPLDCFVALGFDVEKLANINGSLLNLSIYLLEPFLSTHTYNLENWQLEKNIGNLLADKRWWFRSAGPADLFLLMRAFQGIVLQLKFLKVSLDWWGVLQESVGSELIQKALDIELEAVAVNSLLTYATFSAQAKSLCVQVKENEELRVDLTFPAEMALDLEQLIPENVSDLLDKDLSINLNQILDHLKNNGLLPQLIFEINNGIKRYKVWLE